MMSVKYTEVLERMKRSAGLKNDSKVARSLDVTPQALSNYKKRGKVPSDLILKFASIYGLSVDWLLTGEGRVKREGAHVSAAREEASPYGAGTEGGLSGIAGLAALTPEELVCVGKLLKAMRGLDRATVSVLKWTVDAFVKASEEPKEEKEEKKKD
ncbi:MAG: helix-turn-helix domain-containing protein [Deltaproteobacteria bacterium]|nr:helix-turn-helix domain-containing protein [Deltaproteobacteria bacterium]